MFLYYNKLTHFNGAYKSRKLNSKFIILDLIAPLKDANLLAYRYMYQNSKNKKDKVL